MEKRRQCDEIGEADQIRAGYQPTLRAHRKSKADGDRGFVIFLHQRLLLDCRCSDVGSCSFAQVQVLLRCYNHVLLLCRWSSCAFDGCLHLPFDTIHVFNRSFFVFGILELQELPGQLL